MELGHNEWHVDKRISIGHIVTTLVVAISLVVWSTGVDKKVDLNTKDIVNMKEKIKDNDVRNVAMFNEIKNALIRIEDKIGKR